MSLPEISVLIVGDGNFSFSLAFCEKNLLAPNKQFLLHEGEYLDYPASFLKQLGFYSQAHSAKTLAPANVTCSSFDSYYDIISKYPESFHILKKLMLVHQVNVLHSINAWSLENDLAGSSYDLIIWNHPHLGCEDLTLHRFLLAHFFHSASIVLFRNGCVVVSLVEGQSERWNLESVAKTQGFTIFDVLPFDKADWKGYDSKRNCSAKSFQNSHTQKHTQMEMKSYSYIFVFTASNVAILPNGSDTHSVKFKAGLYGSSSTDISSVPDKLSDSKDESIQKFRNKNALSSKKTAFACVHCRKEFKTDQGRFTHTRQVHELHKYGSARIENCGKTHDCFCGRNFASENARWQHQISQHSAKEQVPHPGLRKLVCGQIVTSSRLYAGMDDCTKAAGTVNIGGTSDFYPCMVCGQAVPNKWSIKEHLELLKPVVGVRAQCNICKKEFNEYRALRQHENFCQHMLSSRIPLRI